ncbi:carboxylesterase/lipase family protein [Actinoalloteichus sp. GBA129-24]|uniref:carboxylesterase/lipase family protein n=1 Tax=Actinoalloteichus sp. GBA129-24 TaxID=1612551 RepID=UPI000950574B|nr:carboxylesterase family protein [Actinoalloteichus sp. GBA129-24]APU19539.1 carboxylesterase type B [Actinoalloteichus sp. GBA129-24]
MTHPRPIRWAAAAAGALLLTGCANHTAVDASQETPMSDDLVTVDTGPIRGVVADDHRRFQGIPYAAASTGENRWAPPRPAPSWSEVRDATEPGSPCPQIGASYADTGSTDEDCLVLNVTTPMGDAEPRPVMVWLHGDGAVGSGDLFDGTRLAVDGDVVVVTVNYRLGLFGGFGLPGLADSGTFGLQDQRAALEWVQRNAAAFGGDPDNVTLFGVSYGATATSAHLVSPDSQGLFHRAILQSGFPLMDAPAGSVFPGVPALPWFGWTSSEQAEALGSMLAGELGCADPAAALECLRALPVETLLDYPQVMNMFQQMAYDNDVLPGVPGDLLAAGDFAAVPVLSGATRDEHRTFVGTFRDLIGQPVTAEQYPDLLVEAFGTDAALVAAEYPLSDYASPSLAFATVLTDRMWALSTFRHNGMFAAKVPTYAYEFADSDVPSEIPFPADLPSGAFHSAETSYLFRSADFVELLTPAQLVLSDQMISYWTNFARSGDPNGVGLPDWAPFDEADNVLSLAPGDAGIAPVDYVAEHRLDFWRDIA